MTRYQIRIDHKGQEGISRVYKVIVEAPDQTTALTIAKNQNAPCDARPDKVLKD